MGLELRLSNQGCVNDISLRPKLALPTGSAGESVSTVGIWNCNSRRYVYCRLVCNNIDDDDRILSRVLAGVEKEGFLVAQ